MRTIPLTLAALGFTAALAGASTAAFATAGDLDDVYRSLNSNYGAHNMPKAKAAEAMAPTPAEAAAWRYCAMAYDDFDPRTGLFTGKQDGQKHRCQ